MIKLISMYYYRETVSEHDSVSDTAIIAIEQLEWNTAYPIRIEDEANNVIWENSSGNDERFSELEALANTPLTNEQPSNKLETTRAVRLVPQPIPRSVPPARYGPWMQTYTGKAFHILDPQQDEIDIIDIARHLSQLCRYTGATRRFYSVAEHCVHVSHAVPARFALDGLMHDSAEYITGDAASPLKALMPEYKALENRIAREIALKFGLTWPIPNEVKRIDAAMLVNEREALMAPPPMPWADDGVPVPEVTIHAWESWTAYEAFMDRFLELVEGKGYARNTRYA